MAGGTGGGDGEPEFQVAPMIDVLLVLLIFFMSITTAQVMKVDKTIELPIAKDAIKKDNTRSEVIVNVRWDPAAQKASYVLDERTFAEASELTKVLADARKVSDEKVAKGSNPQFRIVIRGDRQATAMSVSRAMNAAAEAGISDISFSTTNKD